MYYEKPAHMWISSRGNNSTLTVILSVRRVGLAPTPRSTTWQLQHCVLGTVSIVPCRRQLYSRETGHLWPKGESMTFWFRVCRDPQWEVIRYLTREDLQSQIRELVHALFILLLREYSRLSSSKCLVKMKMVFKACCNIYLVSHFN